MKLKFFLKNNKKNYTLKEIVDGQKTKDAHYKFIKVRDAPSNSQPRKELRAKSKVFSKTNVKFVRKN